MTWDVVVAGAGPAGAIAAIRLARAGARVLLLERSRFPRPKLCGDTVNPGAARILRALDADAALEGALPISGMVLSGPDVSVRAPYPPGVRGHALARTVLDERLARLACHSGAVLEEHVLARRALVDRGVVTGLEIAAAGRPPDRIRARVVIAADGHHSRVARSLGLSRSAARPRRWALGGYVGGVSAVGAMGEMHVRHRSYIGIAPMPDGCANVCVVTADGRRLVEGAAAMLEIVRQDPLLASRFARARILQRPVLLGPLAVDGRRAGAPGLLLAGDAAGFIDPMTGDGLRFAFEGAVLAADEALRALNGGWQDAHLRLQRAREAAFAGKWRFNRALRGMVDKRASLRAAALGARVAPAVLRRVVRYAGDIR